MGIEYVYPPHDNAPEIVLTDDGEAVDATPVTRVRLWVGATELDSDVVPSAFSWPVARTPNTGPFAAQTVQAIRLVLGGQGLAAGQYRCRVVTYDPDHGNGLVWTERLALVVVPEPS